MKFLFSAPRAQLITRPTMSTPTGIMRPQTVTGQVTLQPQTRPHDIALSRPGGWDLAILAKII